MDQMEKRITVRVVEWTSHNERTEYAPRILVINTDDGVEAAVRVVYPVFPGVCRRVVLVPLDPRLNPVLMWDVGVGAWVHSRGDAYRLMQEGDVVEIQVLGKVAGPDTKGPGRPVPVEDAHEFADTGPPADPQASGARLVSALLRQLERV